MHLLLDQTISSGASQVLVRSKLRAVSRRMGFAEVARERIELIANELVTNQVKHAGGHGLMQVWEIGGQHPALDIFALDFGPGVANLPVAMQDGYTTAGTMGKGLGAVSRLAAESGFYTVPEAIAADLPWHGLAVWARLYAKGRPSAQSCQTGTFLRAYQDAACNGDAIFPRFNGRRVRWLHCDGLGHGQAAAEALRDAAGVLDAVTPLDGVLDRLSTHLRGGRGAVAIAAEVDIEALKVRLCGVGDMAAYLFCNGERRTVSFAPGVLGHEHRSGEQVELPFPPQALLLTASDGLRRNWGLEHFPSLWRAHPQLIAFLLGNTITRNNDDKSIFVVRTTPHADAGSACGA